MNLQEKSLTLQIILQGSKSGPKTKIQMTFLAREEMASLGYNENQVHEYMQYKITQALSNYSGELRHVKLNYLFEPAEDEASSHD